MRLFKICIAAVLLNASVFAAPAVWTGKVAESFASGKGSAFDPYIIETAEQFALMAKNCETESFYKLAADIALNSGDAKDWAKSAPKNKWTVCGDTVKPAKLFLDGAGHSVSGLYVNSDKDYQGLFGVWIGSVNDLTIKNSYVKGASSVGTVAGAFITAQNGVSGIKNVSVETNVEGRNFVGGLIGTAGVVVNDTAVYSGKNQYSYSNYGNKILCGNALINDVSVSGTVSGNIMIGGVIGFWAGLSASDRSRLVGAVNKASVKGDSIVGGVFGEYKGPEWGNTRVGQLVLMNCVNYGDISGIKYVAGIANSIYGITSYHTNSITGKLEIDQNRGDIQNFANFGKISAKKIACGLVDSEIKFGYNAGQVSSDTLACDYGRGARIYDFYEEHRDSIREYSDSLGAYFIPDTGKTLLNKGYPLFAYWHKDKLFDNGSGTKDDPYLIKNLHDLRRFERHAEVFIDSVRELRYYRQEADIELPKAENNWKPVNAWWISYDGNGHSISNLNITDSNVNVDSLLEKAESIKNIESYNEEKKFRNNIGFFDSLESSQIHDLSLQNVNIQGGGHVGALWSGRGNAEFSGITVTGSVKGLFSVGGIAGFGQKSGKFFNVTNYADVTGVDNVYGIGAGDIYFSRNYGNIKGYSYVAGISGSPSNHDVKYVYNRGDVSGDKFVGGLVTYMDGRGSLVSSYNAAKVTGNDTVGAIVASAAKDTIGSAILYDKTLADIPAIGVDGKALANSVEGVDSKTLKSAAGVAKLGLYYTEDSKNENDGYPIFTFFKGTGSKDSPYLIGSAQELMVLSALSNEQNSAGNSLYASFLNDKHFKITADIDLNASEKNPWVPLFSCKASAKSGFKGSIDGDGHVISGIYTDSLEYSGLVGVNDGTIKNIGIAKSSIRGQYAGAIAGVNHGIIENCWNESATVRGNIAGGIAGLFEQKSDVFASSVGIGNYSTGKIYIDRTYNAGDVSGTQYAGGLVGFMNLGTGSSGVPISDARNFETLANSYNVGNVSSEKGSFGGLVGSVAHLATREEQVFTLKNLYNTVDVCASAKSGSKCTLTADAHSKSTYIKNVFYLGEKRDSTVGVAKTSKEMKSSDFVTLLGDAFEQDSKGSNDGYPVISKKGVFDPNQYEKDQTRIVASPLVFRNLQVSVAGREIRLDNVVNGAKTSLYDVHGRLLWSGSTATSIVIPVQKPGMYIAKNKFQMAKIVVR